MDDASRATSRGNPDTDGARKARIRSVVYDFLSRKNSGEHVTAEDYQSSHPDLMPDLGVALDGGMRKLRLLADAERAPVSTIDGSPVSQPLPDGGYRPSIRHYTLMREISGGSQGTVFEAIHEITQRRVAVKVMTGVSKNSVARFDREARAMAGLDHPGLVRIIDRGRTAQGAYYLTMDFVSGHDLDQWVELQPRDVHGRQAVIRVFSKISTAIGIAHAQGVVHRDLKPSNVRVDGFGEPHVVDFGLAHLQEESERNLTVTGNIVGSIPWASPEQAGGMSSKVGPASDVYSLGVLLYHALGGRFPYNVDAPLHEVTRTICHTPPVPLEMLENSPFGAIDAALSEIVARCLKKDPAERFQSGAELAAALGKYLQGHYVPAPRKMRWKGAIAAGVAAVLLGGGLLAARWRADQEVPTLVLRLPSFHNSAGMEMVQIPAGDFRMGSSVDERGHDDNEDEHRVYITRPFHLSRTEVTRGQFRRVMGFVPEGIVGPADDNLPVDMVSREDVVNFCKKLSEREGFEYRLPTEAEWEYACRSGTRAAYAGSGRIEEMAWFTGNSGRRLHLVGTKSPNQWGLYDMHGNVAEMVQDTYVKHLGSQELRDPIRAGREGAWVVRGGSATSSDDFCRAASRMSGARDASHFVGFRVVAVPQSDSPQ